MRFFPLRFFYLLLLLSANYLLNAQPPEDTIPKFICVTPDDLTPPHLLMEIVFSNLQG